MALTDKQRLFCEYYIQCWNATQAARQAGYKGNDNTLRSIGSENLTKPNIQEFIQKRVDEVAMSSNEVLKRLTDWGRGSIEPFLTSDDYSEALSVNSDKAKDKLGLIKKIKQNERVLKSEGEQDGQVLNRTFELELHDPKDAVDKIARIRGMYNDRIEHSGKVNFQIVDVDANGDPITD